MVANNEADDSSLTEWTALNGFNILCLIQSARQTYGLRTADYARYHRHCTRKIRSLRIATNTTHKGVKNGRRVPISQATSSSVASPTSTAVLGNDSKKSNAQNGINAPFPSRTKDITGQSARKDTKHLHILLWEAERAWAEGMRTREELALLERSVMQERPRLTPLAAKRHRVIKRLQRAASHAQHLGSIVHEIAPSKPPVRLTKTQGVEITVLQADIYSLYMQGTAEFMALTTPNGQSLPGVAIHALQLLATSYMLLNAQAEMAGKITDSAIAAEYMDELEPMIRFCARSARVDNQQSSTILQLAKDQMTTALQIKGADATFGSAQKTLAAFQQTAARGNGSVVLQCLREIKWRGLEIPIRNAELSRVLGKALSSLAACNGAISMSDRRKARHARVERSPSTLATYDRVLALFSDSEICARSLVEENRLALLRAQSARFEASKKPLLQTHDYVTLQLLLLRVRRDSMLLDRTLNKSEKRGMMASTTTGHKSEQQRGLQHLPSVLKLLDGILQSLQQARSLQIVEEDASDLAEQIDNRLSFEKSRRCLHLAQLYSTMDKPDAGLLLVQKASLYMRPLGDGDTTSNSECSEDDRTGGRAGIERVTIRKDELAHQLQSTVALSETLRSRWYESSIAGDSARHAAKISQLCSGEGASKTFDIAYNYIASADVESLHQPSGNRHDHSATMAESTASLIASVPAFESLQITQPSPIPAQSGSSSIWKFFGRSSSKTG